MATNEDRDEVKEPQPGWGGYRKTSSRIDEDEEARRLRKRIRGHLRGIAIANMRGDKEAAKEHTRYLKAAHDELM